MMGLSRTLKIFRRKVEPRLIYSPFLRLILFNVWFQLGFGAFACVLVAGALYLPKMWRVSPVGFLPEIRISWLDMTQNWALKRSARKYMAEGDYERAAKSWEAAVAQNPADPVALRGFLDNSVKVAHPDKRLLISTASQMPWLLRLTGTNMADLELVARVCNHLEWHDALLRLALPVAGQLSAPAEAAYIKALFHEGRAAEFQARLNRASPAVLSDPELNLYRTAFTAGWSYGTEQRDAAMKLQSLSEEGSNAILATRLAMLASAHKADLKTCGHYLERLAARDEASIQDHTRYWALLAQNGRLAEAKSRAEAFTTAPGSAAEVILLAQTYHALGLIPQAREVLQHFAPAYSSSPGVWMLYGTLLRQEKDWPALRTMALRMREDAAMRSTLWGYSYLMEGCAEAQEGRSTPADIAFKHAADANYEVPAIALTVAKELTQLKQPRLALQVLAGIETPLENEYAYWNSVFDAAFAAMDHELVLKSAERCYKMRPSELSERNRYAAALMLNRSNATQAIELTLQLYAKYPSSPTTIINHSCALLLNHRAAEARSLLERLRPADLGPTEAQAYYLALFETYHDLKLWDLAEKLESKIDSAALFPIQRQWLEAERKDLPANRAQNSKA
jgi:tetratricopeptide (TPR) repeat protein